MGGWAMRLPRGIGVGVCEIVREQRSEGIDLVTADHGDSLATCTACGSATAWLSTAEECAGCAIADWREWEHREGCTSDYLRDALDLAAHPRVLCRDSRVVLVGLHGRIPSAAVTA